MAKAALISRIFAFGGRRLSKDSNSITFDPSRAEVPNDDFESKVDQILKGAHMLDLSVRGGSSVDLELQMLQSLKTAEETASVEPFTMCLVANGAIGTTAAMAQAKCISFKWTGARGQRQDFEADFAPEDYASMGLVLYQGVGTAGISGATVGAAVNLGAVLSTEELVVCYHVLNPPGVTGTTPTLDGKVQSASDAIFTTPVDRVTFPQMSVPDGSYHTLAGPITDAYWRVNFAAPGGTTPNFTVLVAAAIRTK